MKLMVTLMSIFFMSCSVSSKTLSPWSNWHPFEYADREHRVDFVDFRYKISQQNNGKLSYLVQFKNYDINFVNFHLRMETNTSVGKVKKVKIRPLNTSETYVFTLNNMVELSRSRLTFENVQYKRTYSLSNR